MTIKHLVISGGGATGLSYYGALKQTNKEGKWNIENITSIYACSVGSMIAVILALRYEWTMIDNYLINKPWEDVFVINLEVIWSAIESGGIYNRDIIDKIFVSLLEGKGLSLTTTLLEFYQLTNIELYIFTTALPSFTSMHLSHKTHPDMPLLDAVYASCSIPLLFIPLIKFDQFLVDGGIMANNPINTCVDDGHNVDEILGIDMSHNSPPDPNKIVGMFTFLLYFINGLIAFLNKPLKPNLNIIRVNKVQSDIGLLSIISDKKKREELIAHGELYK